MAAKKAPRKWTVTFTLAELKKAGTAQNRKIYTRHGVSMEMFGVSYAELGRLRKEVGQDHSLALELWNTHNHDARVLATMVADPSQMSSKDLDAWVESLDNYVISDAFVKIAAQSRFARAKADAWRKKTKNEWIGRVGWMLVATIASREQAEDRKWLGDLIPIIRDGVHDQKNRIKDAMNYALIAIGGTHEQLLEAALGAADAMGPVEVDHGETGCKTRPAREYIESMWKRRAASATKSIKKAAEGPPKKKSNAPRASPKKVAKKTPRRAAPRTAPKK